MLQYIRHRGWGLARDGRARGGARLGTRRCESWAGPFALEAQPDYVPYWDLTTISPTMISDTKEELEFCLNAFCARIRKYHRTTVQ